MNVMVTVLLRLPLLLDTDMHAYDKYDYIWLLKRILAHMCARGGTCPRNVNVEGRDRIQVRRKTRLDTQKKGILILLLISFAPMKLLKQSFDFDDTMK